MGKSQVATEFLAFREQCIWLRICFTTFEHLFESGRDTLELLERSAPRFFMDLNAMLGEYCRLQVCRLTDRAQSFGKDNLTVSYLDEQLAALGLLSPVIETASSGIAHYRTLINASRNKLISHADKATILAGKPVGEHPRSEVDDFFDHLYTYVDEVGRALGVGPLDFRATPGAGDVQDLIRVLRRAVESGEQ